MQQAIYNNISIQTSPAAKTGTSAPKTSGLLRWAASRWELVGVVALMGASAAYGVFALGHLGL